MSDSAIHSAAGALGGIVAMTATYPLVFLSTRAAVETKKANKSTKTAILEILEREGFFGLYAGLNSSLLGIAVTNGIYYYFYERTKGALLSSRNGAKALTTAESMLTGAIAGAVTSTLANPLWVIQTTQATQTMADSAHLGPNSVSPPKKKSMNIIETLRFILQKDGITALWRGLGPALVLVSNPVIQYTVFEQLKNALVRRRTEVLRATGIATAAVLSDWDFFLLGALSKLVATGFTYPYLVVKSRLQAGHSSAAQYKSTYHGLLTIIRAEGLSGLYKGIGSKLLQSVLTAAILFASQRRLYELTKKIVQPVKAI